jgi:hypothetical protein
MGGAIAIGLAATAPGFRKSEELGIHVITLFHDNLVEGSRQTG